MWPPGVPVAGCSFHAPGTFWLMTPPWPRVTHWQEASDSSQKTTSADQAREGTLKGFQSGLSRKPWFIGRAVPRDVGESKGVEEGKKEWRGGWKK